MATIAEAVEFLEQQRVLQASAFAPSQGHYVLTFLGTSSARGLTPALSMHRLLGLTPIDRGFRVELRGELQRRPFPGEVVTVSLTDWERYRGYQLKTEAQGGADPGPAVAEAAVALRVVQAFTVHHTPNTVHMFERIPVEDVLETARVARWAVAGVGPMANISPRFLTAFSVQEGTLALFHGDGEANKTWMNLQQNSEAARIAFDLADGRGFLFEGPCEELAPGDAPEAFQEVQTHHLRMGYGPPSRVYRQRVRRIAAVRGD